MMRIRHRRRGGMYVAVLMTAMIVTVIGLSSLAATRIQFSALEGARDATAARFYARSAVELGLFAINNDPSWRTTFVHNVWTAERPIGDGRFRFKLVDERNGNLALDATSPVRVYGEGSVGDAVRVYSARIEQETTDPSNLLRNPGMESGTLDWVGEDCTLVSYGADRHSGALSLAAQGRVDYWAGPYQDVTAEVTIGSTYEIEAWVKMRIGTAQVRVVMWVGREWWWQGPGGQWLVGPSATVGDTQWTRVSAELTPTWSGTLNVAYVKVDTVSAATDFYVDDVVFRESGTGPRIVPIAGTWRREVK